MTGTARALQGSLADGVGVRAVSWGQAEAGPSCLRNRCSWAAACGDDPLWVVTTRVLCGAGGQMAAVGIDG